MKLLLVGPEPETAGLPCPGIEVFDRDALKIVDPVEALSRLVAIDPAIVFLSPALDPRDAAAFLRTVRARPEGERIALAAWAPRRAHAALYEAGADACLAVEDPAEEVRRQISQLLRVIERADRARQRIVELLDRVDDVVYAYDAEGRFTFVNTAIERLTKWAKEEVIGRPVLEIITAEAVPVAQEMLRRKLRGEATFTRFLTEVRTKDGSRIPFEVSSSVLRREGHTVEGQGVARDIRKRLEEEERRRADEARLRAILDAIPDAVARFNADDVCIEWKPGVPRELYPPEDFEGRHAREIMGPLAEGTIANFAHVRRTGQPVRTLYRGTWGGRERYYEARILPFVGGEVLCIIRDMTEERLRERELLRLAAIVESSQDAIVARDRQGRIVLWNRGAEALYGYTAEEALGRTAEFIVPPELWEESQAAFQAALAGRETLFPDTVRLTKSGERVPLSLSIFPVRDREGRVVGVAGIARDRREEKAAIEALRRSEANYRAVVETTSDSIWVAEPDGEGQWRILFVNSRAQELLHWPAEEQVGRTLEEVLGPEGWATVRPFYEEAAATGKVVFYEREADYRGVRRYVAAQLTPVMDDQGRCVRIVGSARDLTERFEAEEARRQAEERLRLALSTAPLLLLAWDSEGVIRLAEGTEWGRLGVDPARLVGVPFERIRDLPEDVKRSMWAVLRGHEFADRFELRGRILETRARPVHSQRGDVVGGVAVSFDVTEQRRTEEALAQMEKMESLGVLAGGVAHDFNNLLVAILGNVSLARAELPPDSPVQEILNEIHNAGQRAAELARQMLAYAGKAKFVVSDVDLSRAVADIAALLESSVRRNAALELDLAPGLPPVRGDATQLRQVVMNLVLNGADAIGDGHGVITVRTGVMHVDRDFLREAYLAPDLPEGEYVFLQVRDTGCGMDEATKARIFDPFFTTKFMGRGLGLAAVLGIVRGHHGAIHVQSAPNRGTTFTVIFPPAERAPGPEPALPGEEASRPLLLVADDDPTVRRVTERALETLGYRAVGAGSGEEALRVVDERRGEVALALVDYEMPGLSGPALVEALRERAPGLRIVVMSGFTGEETAERMRAAGADAFLPKPFELEELRRLTAELLGAE